MRERVKNELNEQLRFGSRIHNRVVDALKNRLKMSEKRFSDRWAAMAKNEDLFQAYIPEQDVDAVRRLKREQQGVPDYRTIEIPYSYAVLMTAHTYYSSVFCSRTPVFQLAGRHGEAENNKVAIETLLNYQVQVGAMMLPLFVWLLDPGKYGYGVVMHHWDTETVRVRTKRKQPRVFLGMPIPGTEQIVDSVEEIPGYEGNRLLNVRAQDFLPDPRVALVHFQRGEFVGRYVEVPWNEIYEGQFTGRYFNYEVLKAKRNSRDGVSNAGVPQRDKGSENVTTLPDEADVDGAYDVPIGYVKSHEVYIKLIPSEWNLGKGDRQEIWVFNISSNGVLYGAVPLGEWHGKFPFDLLVDEIDGYTIFPKASIERVRPLNDIITWLINTHFYNVRQTLNNQFIVDPSMVVMKDVENPGPGKIIRLKPSAYGKDVKQMIHQLTTVDITRTHIGDIGMMQDFIQRVTGVNDTVMGAINTGDRTTATEIRHSTSFGINRLKTQCEWFSNIGFGPLSQKLVQRTQQHYTAEKQFRLVGDAALLAPTFTKVSPDQIAGFYDFETVDGTLPVDRFAQANLWQMIMGQMKEYPQIMMTYDIAKIFAWVAHLAGIKNMAQFRLVPDATALQGLQSGNVVPITQAAGAAGVNLNEPRQIANVGPTG